MIHRILFKTIFEVWNEYDENNNLIYERSSHPCYGTGTNENWFEYDEDNNLTSIKDSKGNIYIY